MATLGEQAVGSIVKLSVDDTPWNFIVVHQGRPGTMYDTSCDGTWLLMSDLYTSRTWDSSKNDYANSDIHSYLNDTFINLFDNIKNLIKQVKLPYTKGTGSGGTLTTGSSGISTKVFLPSYTEIGFSGDANTNVEGAVLDYFSGAANSKRVAKLNGTATNWHTRSPLTKNALDICTVASNGSFNSGYRIAISQGVRPTLILPPEIAVSSDGMVGDSGAITGSVIIGGVQRELTGAGYINIGGVLRDLSDAQTNIGGTLKSLKG